MKTLSSINQDIDFTISDNLESVVQRVNQRLLFFRGEYFIDGSLGIPYLEKVLGHNIDIVQAQQAISSQIRTVSEVLDVYNVAVSIDNQARKIAFSANVKTRFGITEISQNIGT